MGGVSIELPDEVVEQLTERIKAEVLASLPTTNEDRWLRGYEAIAEYVDLPLSTAKKLGSTHRLPVKKDGRGVIARTSWLDGWMERGGRATPPEVPTGGAHSESTH